MSIIGPFKQCYSLIKQNCSGCLQALTRHPYHQELQNPDLECNGLRGRAGKYEFKQASSCPFPSSPWSLNAPLPSSLLFHFPVQGIKSRAPIWKTCPTLESNPHLLPLDFLLIFFSFCSLRAHQAS